MWQSRNMLRITARQYGEVVLPDASTGHGSDTLATKLSWCKEGMAHFLPSGYRVLWPLRGSRYRAVKVLVNYPGIVKLIGGSGAVRVCQAVLSCLVSRSRSKKCDKQLTHIVRVGGSTFLLIIDVDPITGAKPNPLVICLFDCKYTRFSIG